MESNGYMLSTQLGSSSQHLSPSAQATINKHLPKFSTKRLMHQQSQQCPKALIETNDVACLTDLCSSENLPEIELFSLLEEKIPKYKVRSDFLTDFAGYTNQDWFVSSPALNIPLEGLGLTKEQTRETLNYFLLCGNRVSQMTRVYDDIEAVTRLLEEKEKDLELTVQIGKELLTQNNVLETRISELEVELKNANEDRAQLLHELHKKNELISVLTTNDDDCNEGTPLGFKSITLDLLQKKVTSLQDENKALKMEATELAHQTDEVEAHEKQLMEDIAVQLSEANTQCDNFTLEIERQREENRLQHEQIVSLTARLEEAEMKLDQLNQDHDKNLALLNITKDNQNSLAYELFEYKKSYQEVSALLQETQEQLRKQRKKSMPQGRSSFLSTSMGQTHLQLESLQSELMESSLYSEISLDSGIAGDNQRINDRPGRLTSQMPSAYGTVGGWSGVVPPYRKVFDTVRCASKSGHFVDNNNVTTSQLGAMSLSTSSTLRVSTTAGDPTCNSHPAGSFYRNASGYNDNIFHGKTLSCESLITQSDDEYPSQTCGIPGVPGAKDLEAALKRLTPAEVLARRAMLSYAPAGTYTYDEHHSNHHNQVTGIRTPDSIMSTGSSGVISSNLSMSMHQWRLPEKLQIVKPIEGSQTLHHWSRLATPTLSGLLDERPGVTIRGGKGLDDLGMHVYTLSDVEEDVNDDVPGKQFEISGCTYTYTTSTVMHPDDGLLTDLSFLSQSQLSSRMASTSTSREPSCPPTPPRGLSRKNSCSTFSVDLSLASLLNERGIKAVTLSALNTPAGPNFSPTVTPCNSPEGSPTRSRSPEPLFSLLTTGANLIRKKLVGGSERPNCNQKQLQQSQQQKIMLSRLEKRAVRSLRLVEKVESIGLENIIPSQKSPVFQLASGIANRSSGTLTHYSSLKNTQSNSDSVGEDLYFDRKQIKDVLHKGLKSPPIRMSSDKSKLSDSSCTSNRVEILQEDCSDKVGGNIVELENHNHNSNTSTVAVLKTDNNGTITNDTRIKQMQRQRSRRNLKNGIAQQRSDLGTIAGISSSAGRLRPDLGKVNSTTMKGETNCSDKCEQTNSNSTKSSSSTGKEPQSITQSFVGTVSSLLFGRKGGWL